MTRLARVARVATLPETRVLIAAAARSETLRDLPRRAVHDRAGLVRDLKQHGHPRDVARSAARHPALRELARATLVVLPVRYVPLGWVATLVTRKVLRRYVDSAEDDPR